MVAIGMKLIIFFSDKSRLKIESRVIMLIANIMVISVERVYDKKTVISKKEQKIMYFLSFFSI